VDGLVKEVDIVVVVEMLMPEATGIASRSNRVPVVVMVCNVQVAEINVTEGVVVADQGGLVVVVEVVPGDGDPVRGADDVDLAVLFYVSSQTSSRGRQGSSQRNPAPW
jgi:hypothetical protein